VFKSKLIILLSSLLAFACVSEDPELKLGEQIYIEVCKVCHAQGINGAPIYGNKKQWGPRGEKGIDELVANATNGFGLMPAKAGRSELTEEEIRTAIKYMLASIEDK
jgi:cytochrome c5